MATMEKLGMATMLITLVFQVTETGRSQEFAGRPASLTKTSGIRASGEKPGFKEVRQQVTEPNI